MKQTVFLCAAILLIAVGANAQAVSGDSLPVAPVAATAASAAAADTNSTLDAANHAPAADANAAALAAAVTSDPSSKSTDQEPQVQGVFKNYNWQATAGYTFFRFYELPGVTVNMNGINLGMVYYPGGRWIGADGEFVGGWGSALGGNARYVQGMGGPRFRWSAPRGLELWGHGLLGRANSLPQTSFGGRQGAFAYEVGGGLDFNIHGSRFAYRMSANLVGTRFFSTYQYSPNVSGGIVFKF
jgi:hypothetical protein